MKKIIAYFHRINIRLCIEALLILLVIGMGIFSFTTVQNMNNKMDKLVSDAEKKLRDSTTKTVDGMKRRSADEFRVETKNLKYSLIKEQFFSTINTEYEASSTTGTFFESEKKPYKTMKYSCLGNETQNSNQNERYMKDTFNISGSILVWCTSENVIFSIIQVDASYLTAFYISLTDKPKIVQQVDLLSRNSYLGNLSAKLISWKYAPEIDGQWFTFQVTESTKARNTQWESDENERYFYQWQTPNNIVLQEYCISTKNPTTEKTNTSCSHVQKSVTPISIQ